MKSWHTDKFASFGTTTLNDAISKAMQESGITGDQRYYKVVSCGRGVVIIPDSYRTQDAKPGEIMKMLGANETLVKFVRNNVMTLGGEVISMELPKKGGNREDFTFKDTYSEENFLVHITPEQYNLLNWLTDHDLLAGHFDYERGHIAHDIEEI